MLCGGAVLRGDRQRLALTQVLSSIVHRLSRPGRLQKLQVSELSVCTCILPIQCCNDWLTTARLPGQARLSGAPAGSEQCSNVPAPQGAAAAAPEGRRARRGPPERTLEERARFLCSKVREAQAELQGSAFYRCRNTSSPAPQHALRNSRSLTTLTPKFPCVLQLLSHRRPACTVCLQRTPLWQADFC